MVAISDAAEAGVGLDEWSGGTAELCALYDAHLTSVLAAMGEGVEA